jgi:antitoxin (DNA-binding transcriptional repressor) of toxin-antitoxin stability system
MKTIEMLTHPPSLEDVVKAAASEAGVVLTKSGQPVAHVIPMPQPVARRTAPLHPGAWEVREGFDETLPDGFWLGGQ